MNGRPDLGMEAVQRLAKLWQVDDDRVRWVDAGFDWWPGRFRVSVRWDKHPDTSSEPAWRLVVQTALLKEIPPDDNKMQRDIFEFADLAPSYAWVYPPAELLQLFSRPEFGVPREVPEEVRSRLGRMVWFQTTVYLREQMSKWLPDFLSAMAVLQPGDAERLAERAAEILGGRLDVSRASEAAPSHFDDMLNMAKAVYLPKGQEDSRWGGIDEFRNIAEEYGRSKFCFGIVDSQGVALETSFGPCTAMISVRSDVSHPLLGKGLHAAVHLPLMTEKMARYECMSLNYMEASIWTDIPQFSSWCPRKVGEDQFEPYTGFFIPNALYRPLVATNAALWQIARARWVKANRWPDLKDVPLREILAQRFKESGGLN